MDASGVVWVGIAVAVLIWFDLFFVELRRIFREAKRLLTRLIAYGDLPIFAQLATGAGDAERIARAAEQTGELIARGQAAAALLRRYIPKGSSPG